MIRPALLTLMLCLVIRPFVTADEPREPQWQRMLTGEDEKKAKALEFKIQLLESLDNRAEAAKVAAELLGFREQKQGADHYEVADARLRLAELRKERTGGQEEQLRKAFRVGDMGLDLYRRGLFVESEALFQEALEVRKKILGENHPDTVTGYNNLAVNLQAQGKFADAQEFFQKALEVRKNILGEYHPDTAASYNNLASNLKARGKHIQAQPLHQKALDICRWVSGENHPVTAAVYNNLAHNLYVQGKHTQARPLFQKALDILRKVLGEDHSDTASTYDNVATNLQAQGNLAEAQVFFESALEIRKKVLGENHALTGQSYNNLGVNLQAQGKHALAQPLHEKALDIFSNVLGEHHPATAESYSNQAMNLTAQEKHTEAQPLYEKVLTIYDGLALHLYYRGNFVEAAELARKALDIRKEVHGEEHADTADSYNTVAACLQAQGNLAEALELARKALAIRKKVRGENHLATANSYSTVATILDALSKHFEAQPLHEKSLEIIEKVPSDNDVFTAQSYNNMAVNLEAQGKHTEAHEFFQKALDLHEKMHGEEHPSTATSYINVAYNLEHRGKYARAQPLQEQALEIREKILGENHPDTVKSYSAVATNLAHQGKHAEAQPLYLQAIEFNKKVFGENHPDTAASYNNLAFNLLNQGKPAEAEPFHRLALNIFRKIHGEEHYLTAVGYSGVAQNLDHQDREIEALPFHLRSLEILEKVGGENHPDTARVYRKLAKVLVRLDMDTKAQSFYQKALDISRKQLGENHPETAINFLAAASNLNRVGQYAQAQPLHEKALDIFRKQLGENHPYTVTAYTSLAGNIQAQGKLADAMRLLELAIPSYEASRLSGASGLERSSLRLRSPRWMLAGLQCSQSPENAWQSMELFLARGLLDQQSDQSDSRLSAAESEMQSRLRQRLEKLRSPVVSLVTKSERSKAESRELAALLQRRREVETRLADLASVVSQRQVADIDAIRNAIPADAALLFWLDLTTSYGSGAEHWVCVLRPSGAPRWEPLKGTGPDGRWTAEDDFLSAKLFIALADSSQRAEVAEMVKQLRAQRIIPVLDHLADVNTLYIVPVGLMSVVPVELLVPERTVSYVPSGTFLARAKHKPSPKGKKMLALGNPNFNRPDQKPATPLPPGGLLITRVLPASAATKARLQPGDVLLKYGDTELTDVNSLYMAMATNANAVTVRVTVWREGADELLVREIDPGSVGVEFAIEPAPIAIANRRRTDALLASLRGLTWNALPGTHHEIDRLWRMFGDRCVALTEGQASEQQLEAIRKAGELAKFRYLHFATHGQGTISKHGVAFESALILAQANLPTDAREKAGEPLINGKLSAAEVLDFWELDAELVTLSACETALGKESSGDGLLGFAQAFLAAGSRSVCLSRWKVDDFATALLMERFYANLLGVREGLKRPMGKAAALAEAKRWLRGLTREQVRSLRRQMQTGGTPVAATPASDRPGLTRVTVRDNPANPRPGPYAHPRYWAAFVLIGDPN